MGNTTQTTGIHPVKPMLAKTYKGQRPSGWLMSEKLDGVRAIWDGQRFISRNGNVFHAPAWFLAGMPSDVILDGELWGGRGAFQRTVGEVRKHSGEWSGIQFMVFDIVTGAPYTQRLEHMQAMSLPQHCQIVEHVKCQSAEHLNRYEEQMIVKGAEGVMLRKPDSLYQQKRSGDLLKVKRFHTEEAVVTGYTEGEGRLKNKIGALVCEWAGKTFKIGTGLSELMREHAPSVGSVVTFSYFELTDGGLPRVPALVAVRDYE